MRCMAEMRWVRHKVLEQKELIVCIAPASFTHAHTHDLGWRTLYSSLVEKTPFCRSVRLIKMTACLGLFTPFTFASTTPPPANPRRCGFSSLMKRELTTHHLVGSRNSPLSAAWTWAGTTFAAGT